MWTRYKGGRGWRRDALSRIIVEDRDTIGLVVSEPAEDGPGYLYRTKGRPLTAWHALYDFGAALGEASERFDVPIPVLFAMMAIEASRVPGDRSHLDPRSIREEPGYISDEKTPHRVSPGIMQTLISTARDMNARARLYVDEDGELELLTREDLFVAERSITLGAAYMRWQIDRVEPDEQGFAPDDPVLLCAAYNAGSVRETTRNTFHLLTYGGESRVEKYIAFHNDMLAIMGNRNFF